MEEFNFYFQQLKLIIKSIPQPSLYNMVDLENDESLKLILKIIDEFHLLCKKELELNLSSK